MDSLIRPPCKTKTALRTAMVRRAMMGKRLGSGSGLLLQLIEQVEGQDAAGGSVVGNAQTDQKREHDDQERNDEAADAAA